VRGFITEECRGANGERIGFDVVLIPAPPIGSDDATGVVQASRGPLAR
jgi:nucleoside-triphosphatase THEP1